MSYLVCVFFSLSSRGALATKDLEYIHVYAHEILPPYGRLNDMICKLRGAPCTLWCKN